MANHNTASRSFIGGLMGFFGVITAIIIIIVVISLLMVGDDKSKDEKVNDAIQSNSNVENENSPFKLYNLKQSFDFSGNSLFASESGNFSWSAISVDGSKLSSIKSYDNHTIKPKNGTYRLFIINAKNTGKEKQDLQYAITDDLILVTSDSVKYSQDEDSTLTVSIQSDKSYFADSYYDSREVNPGIQAKDYAIFDVPDTEFKLCKKELDTFCINIPK